MIHLYAIILVIYNPVFGTYQIADYNDTLTYTRERCMEVAQERYAEAEVIFKDPYKGLVLCSSPKETFNAMKGRQL